MWTRNCPACDAVVTYERQSAYCNAKKHNSTCMECRNSKLKGAGNPFFGKQHGDEVKAAIAASRVRYHFEPGQQVNNLQVVERLDRDKKYGWKWRCQCVCGVVVELFGWQLKDKQSCGCQRSLNGRKYVTNTSFCSIRLGAAARGIEFDISAEYIDNLLVRQGLRCALSGLELCIKLGRLSTETTASLDRIDSSKGYIEGNVWWVHKHINIMKNSHSVEMFRLLCQAVAEYTPQANFGS